MIHYIRKNMINNKGESRAVSLLFNAFLPIILILTFFRITAYSSCAKKTDFYVLSESRIILYQTKDYAIVANYEEQENNEITINTQNHTKVSIDDQTLTLKRFNKVSKSNK